MSEQDHGNRVGRWLRDRWYKYQERKRQEKTFRQLTEDVIETADPVIRQSKQYHKVLREPITGAMEYCTSIVEAIPGPVELSRKGYHASPVVNALFASPKELEEVLFISPEVKAYKAQGIAGDVTALLTMTKHEQTIFGHQLKGDVVMRDVAQRAVSFHDHRVVSIAPDIGRTKHKIMERGLEVLAIVAMEDITTIRSRRAELQEKKAYLNGVLKILGGKNHMLEMFASPDPDKRQEYRKAEKKLAEVEQELVSVREKIATPEHALGYLEGIMKRPGDSLAMEKQSFRLDWKNVRVDDLPEIEGNDIALVEFSVGEELRRSAVLVEFSMGVE